MGANAYFAVVVCQNVLITNDVLPDCDKHDQRFPLSWTYDLSHGPIPMLEHALRQELLE